MALTPVSKLALESALTEPSAYTEIKAILEGTDHTTPLTAGTGITTGSGTVYKSWKDQDGGVIKTTIYIDIDGLRSTAGGDIIGVDGTALACHIGQITTALNGVIFAGTITCFEAPSGGDPDIDLYSATEATGAEDAAITTLAETQLVNAGDHTLGSVKYLTAFPAADEYLYLVCGTTTNADFTVGILFIELYGTAS